MSEALIFRSSGLEIFFREGSSDFLFITFNEMGMRADGQRWWAAPIARKLNYAALGFVSTEPHWFPRPCMLEALSDPAVAAVLRRFPRRIAYGFSMGGYAAIKHSALTGVDAVVALAPQWSIDPSDTMGVDWRFTRFFRAPLHSGMAIGPDDVSGRIVVILDPRERHDAWNADRIAERLGDLTILPAYSTSHYTASALAGVDTASEIIEGARSVDYLRMQRAIAAKRRGWQRRAAVVIRQSARRHPFLAELLLERHAGSLSRAEQIQALALIGGGFLAHGAHDRVDACIMRASRIAPDAAEVLELSAEARARRGDLEGAIQAARRLVEQAADRPGPQLRLASYLRRIGDTAAAEAAVAAATRLQQRTQA